MFASDQGRGAPRVLVITFSGRGNTEFVSRSLVKRLGKKRLNGEAWPLESLVPDTVPGSNLLVVAYSVCGFRPSAHLLEFVRKLSSGEGRPTILLNTDAMLPSNTNIHAAQRLIERGCRPPRRPPMPRTEGRTS